MASFEKHPKTKLWSARFYETGEDGKPRQRRLSGGFKTKKEAQAAFEEYLLQKKEEEKNKPLDQLQEDEKNGVLFSQLAADFLKHKKTRVKESTYYDIESRVTKRIVPFFEGKTVEEITPSMIDQWLCSLSNYKFNYRSTLLTQLRSIFKYGNIYFNLPNVSGKVEKPRNNEKKEEMQIWTPDEFNQFINVVNDPVYHALYWTLYVVGCRLGEALALSWSDFDFDAGKIKIMKSFSYKSKEVTSTKNDPSNRVLSMPKYYANIMMAYREQFPKNRYIFGGDKIINENTIRRKTTQYAEKAEVKRIRLHDFRHSCASLLLHKGVQIVAVSKYLGHANVTQTLDTYAHMLPDDQTAIMNALCTIQDEKV